MDDSGPSNSVNHPLFVNRVFISMKDHISPCVELLDYIVLYYLIIYLIVVIKFCVANFHG